MADIQAAMDMGKFEVVDPSEHQGFRLYIGMQEVNTFTAHEIKRGPRLITEPHRHAAIGKEEAPKVSYPPLLGRR